MAFGGVAAKTIMAPRTEAALRGLLWDQKALSAALQALQQDVDITANAPGQHSRRPGHPASLIAEQPPPDQCQSRSFCRQCQTSVSRARSATNVSPLSDQCQSSSFCNQLCGSEMSASQCMRQASIATPGQAAFKAATHFV